MNNIKTSSPRGGIKVGILGAAGYTGGELIRVLLGHPQAEIVFANSESNAGNPVSDVHEGLIGETDLKFTSEMPFDQVDVVFFCFGHGKSEQFLKEHTIPANVKIIDLAQDFRIAPSQPPRGEASQSSVLPLGGVSRGSFIYGLPETHRESIRGAQHLANPGCFATCIQLAMLPALKAGLIEGDIHVSGVTGSTGAGQKPGATTHFSWRTDNVSLYKTFTHQHLLEINQTVQELHPGYKGRVLFVPQRGCFARGIFVTAVAKCDKPIEEVQQIYADYYKDAAFTHFVTTSPDMKQVVNTNKALVYVEKFEDQLLMVSTIDNLLKGAVGQAVQNMNLMFGLDEKAGLMLKASAF
ncbi:MAG: N-acetyl-gamma-glutamyl-phosphate reductase [Bacteroidaceae bacterium]|nr:N-acetyl-gamma-glutamyl-phosphate reductase [Bacteroidaceae bacterium]